MRNNETHKRLEQIAIDGSYTIAQIQNATSEQVCTLLNVDGLPETFLANMKEVLIRNLQDRDDETDKQFLLANINISAIRARFEDIEFERSREEGKRKITFWLDGKP